MGGWSQVALIVNGEDQTSGKLADDGSVAITLTQTWVAQTDGTWRGTGSDALSAVDGTGSTMPSLGSLLEVGGLLYVVNSSQPQRTGPFSFAVQIQGVCKYAPAQSDNKWNVQVTFSGTDYTQDAVKDKDGNAIVNSAGQPYDPTLKHTYSDEKISISYQTTLEQSESFTMIRGKVNSGSVSLNLPGISRSFDARQLRCDDAEQSGSVNLQNGSATYTVSINLTARADSFVDHVIDQGYYTVDDDTGELIQIKDKYGDLLSAPALLDGNGNQLGEDADPVFNDYEIEDEADFTTAFEGLA